jgi:hypothetical protein
MSIKFLKSFNRLQFVMKAHFVLAFGSDFWIPFIWNLWLRTFQLFECLIHCLISFGAVCNFHFMVLPRQRTEPWNVLCDNVSACTNVSVYVVRYSQSLYQYGIALLCDTVSACTNVAVFFVWYCQCLYQCSSVLFFVIVRACTNVAVLCCVISVPVTMWQ